MTTSAASPTSTPTPTSMPPQMAQKALAYLRRAIEKMKALQAVERVLGSIERVMLNRLPEQFDLSLLVAAINTLNLAVREADEDKVREAVFAVSQELDTATQLLIARDAAIMPYHLRRFCEEETTTLDLNALAALTSFYRALPHSETNRGKYDFVVTRLFSNAEPGRSARHRHLRITREQLAKRLTEMCAAWGEVISRDPANAANISQSIAQFDQFIAEVKRINKFEEMIGREFFQRIRTCKAQIGSLLYLPEVTAASVESNVIINSRFLTLLEIESEEIQTASPALNSLAGAFSDTYSNEPNEISAILNELESSTQHDEAAQERVSRLTNLLQINTKVVPSLPLPEVFVNAVDESIEAPPEPVFNDAPAVSVEMDEELQAFATVPENEHLIAAYCNASADARRLDLHCFLSPLPNGDHEELKGESKSRRAALNLIFQADKIVQTELRQECQPNANIEARVEKLFDQLGQDSDDVRKWIKVAQKHEQNTNYEVLLHVYNQLMSARLRLQSAVVRRNTSEHAEDETPKTVPAQAAQTQAINTPDSAKEQVKIKGGRISLRQWLIIATAILLIAAVGLNFALSKKQQAKDDAEVVRLDRSQMPHGALFTEAKTHQELMICVVTQKWLELSAQQQTEKMHELLTFGQERGVQRLILLDAKGKTIGFLSKEEAFVH
jgi:hypothetical protein